MCMDCVTVPCLCHLLVLEKRPADLKKEKELTKNGENWQSEGIAKAKAELVEAEAGEEDWQADGEDWLAEEAARAEAELAEEEAG